MKKKSITILLIIILIIGLYFLFFRNSRKTVEEAKVLNEIQKYNYHLYDNQSNDYKKLFDELNDVLSNDKIDEKQYVELISKMFIMDFYTLDNKVTNLNIGGLEFVHTDILDNFKLKAKNTIYKYLESNLYGDRKQELPIVKEVIVDSIEQKYFKYGDKSDNFAYYVKVNWSYNKDFGYDKNKMLIFVHENDKLSLVEMS